jgi:hypothetical protein
LLDIDDLQLDIFEQTKYKFPYPSDQDEFYFLVSRGNLLPLLLAHDHPV